MLLKLYLWKGDYFNFVEIDLPKKLKHLYPGYIKTLIVTWISNYDYFNIELINLQNQTFAFLMIQGMTHFVDIWILNLPA